MCAKTDPEKRQSRSLPLSRPRLDAKRSNVSSSSLAKSCPRPGPRGDAEALRAELTSVLAHECGCPARAPVLNLAHRRIASSPDDESSSSSSEDDDGYTIDSIAALLSLRGQASTGCRHLAIRAPPRPSGGATPSSHSSSMLHCSATACRPSRRCRMWHSRRMLRVVLACSASSCGRVFHSLCWPPMRVRAIGALSSRALSAMRHRISESLG